MTDRLEFLTARVAMREPKLQKKKKDQKNQPQKEVNFKEDPVQWVKLVETIVDMHSMLGTALGQPFSNPIDMPTPDLGDT